jgi:formylglycine-generating enzyme required for sulfatase activity
MRTPATRTTIFACLAVTIIVLSGLAYRLWEDDRLDRIHYENDEGHIVIANTTGSVVSLFRAGKTMDKAVPVPDFDGKEIWLPAGSYFLRAEDGGTEAFYPIAILGYGQGSEDDGSVSITIRPLPTDRPESLLPDSGGFMLVPSGPFLFGDRANPTGHHFVWTQAFFVAEFEVSNAEFRLFFDAADGYGNDGNWSDEGRAWRDYNETAVSARLRPSDTDFERFGRPDLPVTSVSWFEAAAFCKWLTSRLGGGRWIFSLPSEAEWEKAARGPEGFDYALGQSLSDAEAALYNWRKNPSVEETVVGNADTPRRYRPNRYGIYHMSGNVVEWTQSLYRPLSRNNPYEDDDRNRDDLHGERVVRGGSWYSASAALLYIAYRDTFLPELRHHDLGFRVVARRVP